MNTHTKFHVKMFKNLDFRLNR